MCLVCDGIGLIKTPFFSLNFLFIWMVSLTSKLIKSPFVSSSEFRLKQISSIWTASIRWLQGAHKAEIKNIFNKDQISNLKFPHKVVLMSTCNARSDQSYKTSIKQRLNIHLNCLHELVLMSTHNPVIKQVLNKDWMLIWAASMRWF